MAAAASEQRPLSGSSWISVAHHEPELAEGRHVDDGDDEAEDECRQFVGQRSSQKKHWYGRELDKDAGHQERKRPSLAWDLITFRCQLAAPRPGRPRDTCIWRPGCAPRANAQHRQQSGRLQEAEARPGLHASNPATVSPPASTMHGADCGIFPLAPLTRSADQSGRCDSDGERSAPRHGHRPPCMGHKGPGMPNVRANIAAAKTTTSHGASAPSIRQLPPSPRETACSAVPHRQVSPVHIGPAEERASSSARIFLKNHRHSAGPVRQRLAAGKHAATCARPSLLRRRPPPALAAPCTPTRK